MDQRLLTREDAARYCSLSPESLSDWIRRGRLPGPIPGTHRFDRKALDAALDKLSGIQARQDEETPLQRWRRERNENGLPRHS